MKRIKEIDGIRGWAALSVVFFISHGKFLVESILNLKFLT